MVKEGYWFGLPPLVAGLALCTFISPVSLAAGGVLVFFALFVFYFFRNPTREIPMEPGVVVSPADGRVVVVKEEENKGRPGKRMSIFLAIWNVHVNRSPAAGTIEKLEYKRGKFLAAWAEKASLENEQNVFTLASEYGEMEFKQIAGWVARGFVAAGGRRNRGEGGRPCEGRVERGGTDDGGCDGRYKAGKRGKERAGENQGNGKRRVVE